jgi:(2Fe-2S) ferredoxin
MPRCPPTLPLDCMFHRSEARLTCAAPPLSPPSPCDMDTRLAKAAAACGVGSCQRHLFLCCDQTEPRCCSAEDGHASWLYLKRRLRELHLDGPEGPVLRTRANCLRICTQGPVAVIYPDGVWYHSCTPEVLEQIIQQHLIQNRVVDAYVFARNPRPDVAFPRPPR